MRWVQRNASGAIVGAFVAPQSGAALEALDENTSPELQAFLAAPVTPKAKPTPREWLARLPQATQDRIWSLALQNASLLGWLLVACGGPTVDVEDPRVPAGLAAFQAVGAMTSTEVALMLQP